MRRAIAALMLAAALGCRLPWPETAAEPLAIPESHAIERVGVRRWKPDAVADGPERFIADKQRIAAIVAFLKSHAEAPYLGFERRRVTEWTLAFQSADDVPLVLWIGPDWIGGVDGLKRPDGWKIPRQRPLPSEERAALLALIAELH